MYTKGIRKIFCPSMAGMDLAMAKELAVESGYCLLNVNGIIYSRESGTEEWSRTELDIEDFKVD